MNNLRIIFFLLTSLSIISCRPEEHMPDNCAEFTNLTTDQIVKLVPYMVDLKKSGQPVNMVDSVKINDSLSIRQYRNGQSFTFKVMVNDNNEPVMPDSTNSTTAARRGSGGWRQGAYDAWCMGGCLMSNPLCVHTGCAPLDNACGCTPQSCGVCEALSCSILAIGMVSGSISIK